MPLSTRWYTFRPDRPPETVGVYELGRGNHVLYIGSGCIRSRLLAHSRTPEKQFQQYRCIQTYDRRRARQIERREQRTYLARHGALPRYNERIG